jgi:hypothetical protein
LQRFPVGEGTKSRKGIPGVRKGTGTGTDNTRRGVKKEEEEEEETRKRQGRKEKGKEQYGFPTVELVSDDEEDQTMVDRSTT